MKKFKILSIIIAAISVMFLMTFAACGEDNADKGKLDNTDSSTVLVAYFSCTGNTEKIAEYISQVTDGELYEITPAVPYTDADLNYGNSSSRATSEQHDDSARPEIDGVVDNMENYDVIYLGYPIWWGEAPKIIYTFIEAYDFSGKTIVPFCTSGSSGIGSSAEHLHLLASGATWLNGKRFSSSSTLDDIKSWIDNISD